MLHVHVLHVVSSIFKNNIWSETLDGYPQLLLSFFFSDKIKGRLTLREKLLLLKVSHRNSTCTCTCYMFNVLARKGNEVALKINQMPLNTYMYKS